MTRHGPALLTLSLIAVAGWTYNVNYDTRAALDRLSALRAEIAGQREALQVLRVEWAYLNAPDRLAGLVAMHNDALGLSPLVPETLGIAAAIPYPPRHAPDGAPADALIAAADPVRPSPPASSWASAVAAEPETMTLAALSHPGPAAPRSMAEAGSAADADPALIRAPIPAETLTPIPAPVEAAADGETVPVALEAAIAAALIEVGVALDEPARAVMSPGGAVAGPAGIISVAASGVPVPEARPAPWSRR